MEKKVSLPEGVSIEQVKEFWKNNIHPITGYRMRMLLIDSRSKYNSTKKKK